MVDPTIPNPPDPNNPNPQSQTVPFEVDLGPAQKAVDEFISRLSSSFKQLTKDKEVASLSLTRAEENYYSTVNKLEMARHAQLMRHHDDMIAKIRMTAQAKEDQIRREVTNEADAQKQIAKLREDTLKKEANIEATTQRASADMRNKMRFGGALEAATSLTSKVGSSIGGTPGMVISEVGNMAGSLKSANPYLAAFSVALGTAIAVVKAYTEQQAAANRTAAGLVGAGFKETTTGLQAEDLRTKLFGAFREVMDPKQQREALGIMSESPRILGESNRNVKGFQNTIATFGNIIPDTTEIVRMLTRGSRDLGMTLGDLNQTYDTSRTISQRLTHGTHDWIQNQKNSLEMLFSMQKSLRGLTADGNVAASVLLNVSKDIAKVTDIQGEQADMANALGQGISGLKFKDMMGMFAFTRGRMPTELEAFGTPLAGGGRKGGAFLEGGPAMVGEFMTKIMSQARTPQQMMAMEGTLQEKFFPGLPMKAIPEFHNLMQDLAKSKLPAAEATRRIERLQEQQPQNRLNTGMDRLRKSVDALARVENEMKNAFADALNRPGQALMRMGQLAGQAVMSPFTLPATATRAIVQNVVTDKTKGARH